MQMQMNRKQQRALRWISFAVGLVLFVVCLTPVAFGTGGRACGPEAGRLYRYVKDEVTFPHGWGAPDVFSFRVACRQHDDCYARPIAPRTDCDAQLLSSLQAVCATGEQRAARAYCALIARGFHDSVRLFGWAAYDWEGAAW